jgi:hypothetical protein
MLCITAWQLAVRVKPRFRRATASV